MIVAEINPRGNLHLTILAEIGLAGCRLVVIPWLAPLYAAYMALRGVGEDYALCKAIAVAGSLFLHHLFENRGLRFGFYPMFYCVRVAQGRIESLAGGRRTLYDW